MTRRVYRPRPIAVQVDPGGAPATIGRAEVEAVREEWLIDDRWWTSRPLRRRYYDLVTRDGVNRVVFRDLESGRWFGQKGA
jgi:hypothetical protein